MQEYNYKNSAEQAKRTKPPRQYTSRINPMSEERVPPFDIPEDNEFEFVEARERQNELLTKKNVIIAGTIITVGIIITAVLLRKKQNDFEKSQTDEVELAKEAVRSNSSKLSYKQEEYVKMKATIIDSLMGVGKTGMQSERILEVFRRLKNETDYNNLVAIFGEIKYNKFWGRPAEGIYLAANSYSICNMRCVLSNEFKKHKTKLEELKQITRSNGWELDF